MKVSIIVPCYNVQNYVEKCIDSIINQSHKNLEIILVNDGSTDDTLEVLKKYDNLYDNVILVNQANGGLSNARNEGVRHSTGDYIYFIDSDDWINHNIIELLLKDLITNNSDISICGITYITSLNSVDKVVNENIVLSGKDSCTAYYYKKLFMEPMVWNKLYKKDLVVKFPFEEGKIHEDKFFTPKVLFEANKVSFIPTCGYNYFDDRADSITNVRLSRRNLSGLEANLSNYDFFRSREEHKLARLAKSKYYEDLVYYYSLYKNDAENEIAEEMINTLKQGILEATFLNLMCFKFDSLIKIYFATLFPNFYYKKWRAKQNG